MKYQYEIVPKDEILPLRFFYSYDKKKTYVTPHWHDYIEIIYILSGCLHLITNGNKISIMPDNMVIIGTNHIHTTTSDNLETSAYVLQISMSFLQEHCPKYENILFDTLISAENDPFNQLPVIKNILHDFYLIEHVDIAYFSLKRNSLLYDISYVFCRYLSSSDKNNSNHFNSDTYLRITEITNYINTSFERKITLDETAKMIGFSSAYLSRFFKKYIGITFSNYLDMVRLDKAYTLVTTTHMPILNISSDCGFANYPLFVKKFSQIYGKTPLKLRQWFITKSS